MPIDWQLDEGTTELITVDALLSNQAGLQTITITALNHAINEAPLGISGAEVKVSTTTEVFDFTEDEALPGAYLSSTFVATAGTTYQLSIQLGDKSYTAQASLAPVNALNELTIKRDTDKNLSYYHYNEWGKAFMLVVEYDWSARPAYCTQYGACSAKEIFYNANTNEFSQGLAPEREHIYFPKNTTLTRYKYGLSEAHRAYIRSLQLETQWRGGLFDVQPANAIGNISNGALGFFAVCEVVSAVEVVE